VYCTVLYAHILCGFRRIATVLNSFSDNFLQLLCEFSEQFIAVLWLFRRHFSLQFLAVISIEFARFLKFFFEQCFSLLFSRFVSHLCFEVFFSSNSWQCLCNFLLRFLRILFTVFSLFFR